MVLVVFWVANHEFHDAREPWTAARPPTSRGDSFLRLPVARSSVSGMAESVGRRGQPSECVVCGGTELDTLVCFDSIPVHVGLLWRSPDEARQCSRGSFELVMCGVCGYVWNVAFDPLLLDYAADYDNALHHSPKFVEWERALVTQLVERHGLIGKKIAELGCGDGRFLALLCQAGDNTGIGFEPGHNRERVSDLAAGADVVIVPDIADADSLTREGVEFVVMRHVLEHLPDPASVLRMIGAGLDLGSGAYVEVPNFAWALRRGAFEDLMYEHCGYYTPRTLAHFFRSHGFDVEAGDSFDGLFAWVDAIRTGPRLLGHIDVEALDEVRDGITHFRSRLNRVDVDLESRRTEGQHVAAWGGGARAVGLLNMVEAADVIRSVVDVNPRKQGTFVAGSGHPIVAPEALLMDPPDTVVVINPVYEDEIKRMLVELDVECDVVTV